MKKDILRIKSLLFILLVSVISACGGGGDGNGNGNGNGGQDTAPPGNDPFPVLDTSNSSGLSSPRALTDADGNRFVIWAKSSLSGVSYLMSSYVNGSWQAPTTIFSDKIFVTAYDVFTLGNGKLLIAWAESTSISIDGGVLYTSVYDPASGWSTPELVQSYSTRVSEVKIVEDNTGKKTIVWALREGAYYNLWSSLQNTGEAWQIPQIRESDLYDVQDINITVDTFGRVTVIWQQGGTGIYYSQQIANIWTGRVTLDGSGHSPHAGYNSNGDIIVAWVRFSISNLLYIKRYTVAEGWGATSNYTTISFSVKYGPYVSVNSSGNAVVAWQFSGGPGGWDPLKAIRYTAGSGWGSIDDIDGNVFFDRLYNVTLFDDATGLIVRRDGNSSIVSYDYDGSSWTAKQTIRSVTDPLFTPSVGMNKAGIGVVAWLEMEGTVQKIRVKNY